jgi:hypothetical protein
LSYLKGSLETCLSFIAGGLKLESFIDVDLAGDVDNRKSTTRYTHTHTLGGTPLSWNFTLQIPCSFNNRSWICCNFRICKRDGMAIEFLERIKQDKWKGHFLER